MYVPDYHVVSGNEIIQIVFVRTAHDAEQLSVIN
jgi:hypothetical protein